MKKRIALISGGGGGLGLATAKAYAREGFEVIASDIHTKKPSESKTDEPFTYLYLNVTSEKDMKQTAGFLQEKYGRLDVLISNAGVFDFYPVSEAGAQKLRQIMDVNFMGLANLVKYFLPLLLKSKGRLIVISSESYKVPAPFQPYAVSKQSLESLYNAIKIELSLKGVKSILIRPGAMDTKILEDTIHFENDITDSNFKAEFASFLDAVPKYIGKIVSPEAVANSILKAGTVKKPKDIYSMNHNPLVSILSYLPQSIKRLVIKNSFK